ncbi:MAG: cohesin domain-containing protein [Candidatus Poribacteria bacterium]|nr:cohesin domain-containing protein [Candidatus Poribacteria bacterium]MDE0503721.1 cohesin domain-containing protein [Candidatus Poribacteria bacterium]
MNSFFRIAASLLAAVCLSIPSLVYGEALVSIDPADIDSPPVGEKLVVDVNISNAENVSAYQLNLKFDVSALSFVGVEFSDYLPGNRDPANIANLEIFLIEPNRVETDLTTNTATLVPPIAAASLVGVGDNEGTLLRATFEVLEYKDSTIELVEVELSTPDGVRLDVTAVPGKINAREVTITEHIPGDKFLLLQGDIFNTNAFVECFIPIWESEFTAEGGTFLEFQLAFPKESVYSIGGVFVHTAEGNRIGESIMADDTNWMHYQVPLDELAGQTIVAISLGTEKPANRATSFGKFGMMADNIQITNGTHMLEAIWVGEDSINGRQRVDAPLGDVSGIENCEVFAVTTEGVSVESKGKRVTTWGSVKTAR